MNWSEVFAAIWDTIKGAALIAGALAAIVWMLVWAGVLFGDPMVEFPRGRGIRIFLIAPLIPVFALIAWSIGRQF